MFGIFKTNCYGEMTWLATVETQEQIEDAMPPDLEAEECAMVIKLEAFKQVK